MDKPFIIQSMYCSHTDKSFLVPDTMEFVAITKDLPQSLHTYRCVPSYDDHCEPHGYSHKEGIHDHLQAFLCYEIFNIKDYTKAGLKSIVLRLSLLCDSQLTDNI